MTDKIKSASFIFVDRRKTGHGKSLPNRERFLRRISAAIRAARPGNIGADLTGKNEKANRNVVSVAASRIAEPTFRYAPGSQREFVLIGNTVWERGDDFPLRKQGKGKGKGGSGAGSGQTEEGINITVSRDEFLDVFFEDCELPDLRQSAKKVLPEHEKRHAGFQRSGNPAQLSIKRSYKNAFARRKVLAAPIEAQIAEVDAELLLDKDNPELLAELELLQRRRAAIPFFEDLDLRYTKKERVEVKRADAVFCMIMDISGSMDDSKKRLARRFFSLQYAFIKRKHPNTDLIFVAHTDEAEEMDETEFFSTAKSGGTKVSPAYVLLNKILSARYDADTTNLYISQASDGDNEDADNDEIRPTLVDSGLLAKARHMCFIRVGYSYFSSAVSSTDLWGIVSDIATETQKISMRHLDSPDDVFSAFQSVYAAKRKV